MKNELTELLRCPRTGQQLCLERAKDSDDAFLVSENGEHKYPIRNGIPRFVPETNYADNFGEQWNHFRLTQLDSYAGHPISADRFWAATNWKPKDLTGKTVIDIGCGAGRFAEIALKAGAKVIAVDYSSAVEACYKNLADDPNILVVQGDIYQMPLPKGCADFVYCLGVIQHTPDVKGAFFCASDLVKRGGHFVADVYERSWKSLFHLKYWLRPATKHLHPATLFKVVSFMVPILLPLGRLLSSVPRVGWVLVRVLPIAVYYKVYPDLNSTQQKQWSILDTWDWLSPTYDNPQTIGVMRHWISEAGYEDVEVERAGHLVARGVRRK